LFVCYSHFVFIVLFTWLFYFYNHCFCLFVLVIFSWLFYSQKNKALRKLLFKWTTKIRLFKYILNDEYLLYNNNQIDYVPMCLGCSNPSQGWAKLKIFVSKIRNTKLNNFRNSKLIRNSKNMKFSKLETKQKKILIYIFNHISIKSTKSFAINKSN
jgi:hypothetical protein